MISVFILFIIVFVVGIKSIPQITIENETGWERVAQKEGIFSNKAISLYISCTSNHPIQWTFEGEFGKETYMWMPRIIIQDVNDLGSLTYEIIYDAEFTTNVSGLITCSQVDDPSKKSQLLVFLSFNSSIFLETEQTFKSEALGFYGVACPLTNPKISVDLIKIEESGRELIIEAPFHPVRGFSIPLNKNPGRYFCRALGKRSKETVEILRYKDLQLTPWTDDMNIFSDESTLFQCNSSTQNVFMEVHPKNIPINIIHGSKHSIILQLLPLEKEKNISISCSSPIAQHIWRISAIEPPVMGFDNNYGDVYCGSNATDKFIQTLRCQDNNRCDFLEHCLNEGGKCNLHESRLDVHYEKRNSFCILPKQEEHIPCVTMKLNHYNGIVRCGIANIWREKKFFISLNLNRYFNWRDAPLREILRINEAPAVLYANDSHSFQCEGSYYLFGRNLVFALRFMNGTTETLTETFFEKYRYQNPDGKYEYSGMRNLNRILSIETVGIDCYAYFTVSKDFLKVSRNFEMRYTKSPYFPNGEYKEKLYFENGTHARIICPVSGEPRPEVSWLFNNQNVINESGLESGTISIDSKEQNVLEIPKINFEHKGDYKCIAINSWGTTSRKFGVEVTMSQCASPILQ